MAHTSYSTGKKKIEWRDWNLDVLMFESVFIRRNGIEVILSRELSVYSSAMNLQQIRWVSQAVCLVRLAWLELD